MAVEGDVRVGEVVHEHELALAGEVDQALHQLGRGDRGRRVVRERDDHDPRRGLRGADGVLDAGQQVVAEAGVTTVAPARRGRDQVDRVARARHDGAVAAVEQHPHQVGEPFLGADRADDVRLGVEPDAEMALVALADGLAEVRQAAARRVAVVHRLGGRLGELLDRDRRRGDVGIAEAEVDHVAPVAPQLAFQLIDSREDVRGKIVDSPELHPEPPV